MSACDTCPKPGSCCKDFVLHNGKSGAAFPENDWMARGTAYAKRHGLPFIPLRVDNSQFTEPLSGHVGIRWMCPELEENGRCGNYMNRPNLCRDYQPGEDRLCVLYVPTDDSESIPKEASDA